MDSPLPQTPTHALSVVHVVKTLPTGGTIKYRIHCDPDATLAGLRAALYDDEEKIMSQTTSFTKGIFVLGKALNRIPNGGISYW
jgi:hypothetical protein